MINKLKIVEEEADETLYWLELITEANFTPKTRLKPFIKEANEILAMTVSSINTLKNLKSKIDKSYDWLQ